MSEFRIPVATNGRFIADSNGVVIAVSAVYGNEISRRVNSHDALVKALREVMRPYGMYDIAVTKSEGQMTDELLLIGERIRAALSAAGAPQ